MLALRLAPLMRPPKVEPQVAYLAGLLHDVGRFVLYLEAPEELRAVDETAWDSPAALIAAEKSICGFTHPEIGFLAAQKWKLPSDLALVIQFHHMVDPHPPLVPARLVPLVKLVAIADWLEVSFTTSDWQHADDETLGAIVARHAGVAFVADAEHLLAEVRAALKFAAEGLQQLGMA
jgi:HD-like signal output (HDOD) protein